jgi:hypothetical protein
MPDWCKLRTDFYRHRKVFKAGKDGALVFTGLLCLNHEHGVDGVIPARWCAPAELAFAFQAFRMSEAEINEALIKLAESRMIERRQDGSIHLPSYDEEYMPRCSRCRTPNNEPRYRTCPDCRERDRERREVPQTGDTGQAQQSPTPAQQNPVGRHRQDKTRVEQDKIGAENRGDLATAVRGISLVLGGMGWGNSDTHRWRRAEQLARRWTRDNIQAVADKARKAGNRPERYFAHMVKSDDWIYDIVKEGAGPANIREVLGQ